MNARSCLLVTLVLAVLPLGAAYGAEPDLRDISIGASVNDLPAEGYTDFVCAADPQLSLSGWSGWKVCPADADGWHAIRFGYDPYTSREGTMVGGHPVLLTVMVDDKATVAGLRIETDPKARLYLRKKAFLLGLQAKSRYGAQGWHCSEARPEPEAQPVGGTYVNERCEKTANGRALTVERHLFRRPNQDMKTFVDETRITIRRAGL